MKTLTDIELRSEINKLESLHFWEVENKDEYYGRLFELYFEESMRKVNLEFEKTH